MQQTIDIQRPQGQTWDGAIIVPLTQNLIGGVAVAALIAVLSVAFCRASGRIVNVDALLWLAGTIGATVAALFTIVRFFGDDLGLFGLAYRAGQHYADERLQVMQQENDSLRAQLETARSQGKPAVNRLAERHDRTQANAITLLTIAYNKGVPAMAANKIIGKEMSDPDWRRARALLVASGCLDGQTGNLCHSGIRNAKQHLQAYCQPHLERAEKLPTYVVPWSK
jgi:hypothetical protein